MTQQLLILLCVLIAVVGISITVVVCVQLITKTVKMLYISRSHLHVFNRKSHNLHAQQIKEFTDLVDSQVKKSDALGSKISALAMKIGMLDG